MARWASSAMGLLAVVAAGPWAGPWARGEDWPTFMHDNQRTGVSSETLRPPLTLQWVFESPFPPAKGWALPVNGYGARKNKPNVAYDDAFRVIAVGDACYFSSSAENRIYAIDAATGKILWTFFTEAAPRLAPAYWEGRLYVGADDGVFRCLRAADGKLEWQIRAACGGDLMLGQGRFSSVWPIRAAGIVDQEVVYFTAGLFPQNYVYLYAVGAADGSLVWRRQLDRGGMDGYVPQGYILSTADSLVLTSRVAPSRWSKQDGTRIDFNTPFPQVNNAHEYRFYNGGTYAQVWNGKHIVYGRACILAYNPDEVLKDRWGRPRNGDLIFNWFNARQVIFKSGQTTEGRSPFSRNENGMAPLRNPNRVPSTPEAIPPSVPKDDVAYLATDDHVLAVRQDLLAELAANECREFEEAYKRLRIANYLDLLDEHRRLVQEHGPDHWKVRWLADGPLKWGREDWEKWPAAKEAVYSKIKRRCQWMTPLEATESLILAGDVLYAGGEACIHAIDASNGKPLWSFTTGSRVRGLAVASGRLYASTIDGKVRSFAAKPLAEAPVTVSPVTPTTPYGEGDLASFYAQTARQLVDHAGSRRGYCLILDGGNGALAAEIAKITDFHVEMIEPDATEAGQAREALATMGLYGGRVCVRQTPLDRLPYAPYVFNLVIDQGSFFLGKPSAPVAEILRVTKPHGGIAFIGQPEGFLGGPVDTATIASDLDTLPKGHAVLNRIGSLWKITRGRVAGSRDWTHNYATAANTYCSEDPLVKGPFGVLWYGEPGPRKRIDRHATPPMPLVSGGIMFTIGPDLVMAYDVYNGVPYWEREIAGATRTGLPINTSNLAADQTSLFIVVGDRECLRLDARTGKTLQSYPVPSGDAEASAWAWIARDGSLLYGSRAAVDPSRRRPDSQRSEAVFALDAQSGQLVWSYRGHGIDHDGIAIGDGRVFLMDRGLTAAERDEALANTIKDASVPDRPAVDRRGNPVPPDLRKLVALNAATGKLLWQKPLNATDVTLDDAIVQGRGGVACMVHGGVVVVHGTGSLGHPHREFLEGKFARRALYAFDVTSGRFLWGGRKGYRKRPIIVGDYVYAEPFAWHLKTGAAKTIANPLSERQQRFDFHRGYIGCGHVLASGAALFGARGGIACCNLDDPCGFAPFAGMAMACGLGAAPAGGVLVVPEGRSGCTCDTPIYTSIALYPKGQGAAWGTGFTGGCAEEASMPVEHVAVNLGAPGYRRDEAGKLWIPYPARVGVGLLGDWLPTYQHEQTMCYALDEPCATIRGTDAPWVFTSGYADQKPLRFAMVEKGQAPARYTVRLYFAEPEEAEPGRRRFSVYLQGKPVLEDFDVVEAAGGPRTAVVKEFQGVRVEGDLLIKLESTPGAAVKRPVLCGFEALRE